VKETEYRVKSELLSKSPMKLAVSLLCLGGEMGVGRDKTLGLPCVDRTRTRKRGDFYFLFFSLGFVVSLLSVCFFFLVRFLFFSISDFFILFFS
jgi:hypothetical protein